MRGPLAVSIFLALVAGCLERTPEYEDAAPMDATTKTDPGGTAGPASFSFRASDYEFKDQLIHLQVVLDAAAEVSLKMTYALFSNGPRDDCVALAAFGSEPTGNPPTRPGHAFIVGRALFDATGGRARPPGSSEPAQIGTNPEYAGTLRMSDAQGVWAAKKGDRIDVWFGGSSDAFPKAKPGAQEQQATIDLRLSGPAHVETLPPVSIRCGGGFMNERETGAGARYGAGGEVVVSTKITLDAVHAGTAGMLFGTATTANGTLTVGGRLMHIKDGSPFPNGGSIAGRTESAGPLVLDIVRLAEGFPGTTVWYLADADWPSVTMVPSRG